MRLKTWAASLAVALTLPFLHGCGNDDANDGQVRIVNATTDYSSIDLYTQDSDGNDTLVVSGTAAGTASGYDDVKRGATTFEIKSGTSRRQRVLGDGHRHDRRPLHARQLRHRQHAGHGVPERRGEEPELRQRQAARAQRRGRRRRAASTSTCRRTPATRCPPPTRRSCRRSPARPPAPRSRRPTARSRRRRPARPGTCASPPAGDKSNVLLDLPDVHAEGPGDRHADPDAHRRRRAAERGRCSTSRAR